MRIWYLPYGYLDSKRLHGQHREIHCLYSCAESNKDWGGWVAKFKPHRSYFLQVHERYLNEVSTRTGFVVDRTPTDKFVLPGMIDSSTFTPSKELLQRDAQHLRDKWERELYRFSTGRLELSVYESILSLHVGRNNDEIESFVSIVDSFLSPHKQSINLLPGRAQDKYTTFFNSNPRIKDELNNLLSKESLNPIIH